jgi:hypothetical protein
MSQSRHIHTYQQTSRISEWMHHTIKQLLMMNSGLIHVDTPTHRLQRLRPRKGDVFQSKLKF